MSNRDLERTTRPEVATLLQRLHMTPRGLFSALLLTAVLLYLDCITVLAQAPDTVWSRRLGGPGQEEGYSVKETLDGGFVVAGATTSYGAGGYDAYVIKTDSSGYVTWTRTTGGSYWDAGFAIEQTFDSGYVLAGGIDFYGTGSEDLYVVRFVASGGTQWAQRFGGTGRELAYGVQQTSDSGFVITGVTSSLSIGGNDCYVVRLHANGSLSWSRHYGGNGWDVGLDIRQTNDGGYVVAGWSDNFHAGRPDFWLLRLSADGDSLWSRVYGAGSWDEAYSLRETTDGGFIIAGNIAAADDGCDFYLVKTDAMGNVQWSRAYDGPGRDEAYAVRQTVDGGYVVVGTTLPDLAGWEDIFVLKVTGTGQPLWSRVIGGPE